MDSRDTLGCRQTSLHTKETTCKEEFNEKATFHICSSRCYCRFWQAASTYTFTAAELAAMVQTFDNPIGNSSPLSIWTAGTYSDGSTPVTLAVGYEASLSTTQANPNHPWSSIGIGFPWGSVPQGDLTGYTDYALVFANDNDDTWWVNLYLNTGWTDAPFSETDTFTENGWTPIAPGETKTVILSLANVPNLNHVTNIGFMIAANLNADGGNQVLRLFHMSVSPVPAPGTVARFVGCWSCRLASQRRTL